jgi:outer membrane murein-binding lipoprotein Lpp
MKFRQAFLAMLFLTATLHAQVPFYGVYPAWQPQYYPGVSYSPYYSQAYYLQPYYAQPYYPQPYPQPYPQSYYPQSYYTLPNSASLMVTDNSDQVDSLTREVQDLNEEISDLEGQLSSAQAQAQQSQFQAEQAQARVAEVTEATPRPPMILVFKNGQHVEAQGYAVMGNILWILTDSGSQRVALSSLNVGATQRVNLQRGTPFPDLRN